MSGQKYVARPTKEAQEHAGIGVYHRVRPSVGGDVDITVAYSDEHDDWRLTDLLGRTMGSVERTEDERFLVKPDGAARETMTGMNLGPFATLDDALLAIETHTRGVCRRTPGSDGAA